MKTAAFFSCATGLKRGTSLRLGTAVIGAVFAGAVIPGPVFAHSGPPPRPADLWSSWTFDPILLVALSGCAWLYYRGLARLWAPMQSDRGPRAWRAECFAGGLAVLLVALVSPLDALGSALFAAHMVQHLLLIAVAAPLLVLGAPLAPILRRDSRGVATLGCPAAPLP